MLTLSEFSKEEQHTLRLQLVIVVATKITHRNQNQIQLMKLAVFQQLSKTIKVVVKREKDQRVEKINRSKRKIQTSLYTMTILTKIKPSNLHRFT